MKRTLFLFSVVLMSASGPCVFDSAREYDCDEGNACPQSFACTTLGYCQSADTACGNGEALCTLPGLEQRGVCIERSRFDDDKAHCGGCFSPCRGNGECVAGSCEGEPPLGRCEPALGHFDCEAGTLCDETNECVSGERGTLNDYERCDESEECRSGLCIGGVCSEPCRTGCAFGYQCESDLCVSEGCKDREEICGATFECNVEIDACLLSQN